MHVRLNNLKKMKNEVRDELLADFKKKEETWAAKLQKLSSLEQEAELLKKDKIILGKNIKEL
jgi:hypothetical protein